MIVTGASQGIGAGVTKEFIKRGYNVVANSRRITESGFAPTDRLVLVDGNIGEAASAAEIAAKAISTFGSIDGVVNNAGIFFTKAIYGLHRRRLRVCCCRNGSAGPSTSPSFAVQPDAGTAKDQRKHHEHHV